MSYVRIGQDGSDVYVFPHVDGGIECCGCNFRSYSTHDIISHLQDHISNGECVPAYVIRDIEMSYKKKLLYQRSSAEVPGFHARTVIDDTIGKLFAVREQLRYDIPENLSELLDDLEMLSEQIVELAYDKNVPPIEDGKAFPSPELMNYTSHLSPSGSNTISFCSCGCPTL